MFSVGILYSIQEFLKFIENTPITVTEFTTSFQGFEATSPSLVLEVARKSEWINVDVKNYVKVTSKGEEIISEGNMICALRAQLKHLINKIQPSWAFLIHKGREEAYQFFPSEVKQCFKEAELISSYENDVIEWWDSFAFISRSKQEESHLLTGRIGERLSIEYEEKRTGLKPVWQSIDSNLVGYDILSTIDDLDQTPLIIEVKTSTVIANSFTFFLSKNEWEVAEKSANYIFHFWILDEIEELYIIDKSDIAMHIPINQGRGYWEKVKIVIDKKSLIEKNRKSN